MKLVAPLLFAAALLATRPTASRIDVYMIGDSTMANRPHPEVNPYRGWGQMLQGFFDDSVAVHNFAVNGRSTKSFIDEGRWAAVLGQLHRGDYVVIQFGHNDEKQQDPKRYTDPQTTFRENLSRFVQDARSRGAIPILCTPIVRRKFESTGTLEDTHGAYVPAVKAVASELHVPLVDLEHLTRALVQRVGPEGSKALYTYVQPGTNEMYPQGLHDDTHLSVSGATQVARLFVQGLRDTGLPLARHVNPGAGDGKNEKGGGERGAESK